MLARRLRPAWGKPLLWVLLALPAAFLIREWTSGRVLAMDLLHPTGETAVRLMILALLPGPLTDAFGAHRFLRAWLSIRRNLGVAAFLYTLLHLVFYVIDMNSLPAIVEELGLPSIWTGWLALALMVPAAATSADRAMRALGRRWKKIQRFVYAAIIASLIHWLLLDWEWQKAAVHAAPLIIVWLLRAALRLSPSRRRFL